MFSTTVAIILIGCISCKTTQHGEDALVDAACEIDIDAFSNFYVDIAVRGELITGDDAVLYLSGVRDPCELFVKGFEVIGTLTFPAGSSMRYDRPTGRIVIRNTKANCETIQRILDDFRPGIRYSLPEPFAVSGSNGIFTGSEVTYP